MNGRFYLAMGALALVSAAATVYWQQSEIPVATSPSQTTDSAVQEAAGKAPAVVSQQQQLLLAPQIKEQEQRLLFHAAYRSFFAEGPNLPEAERNRQAEALRADIELYEGRDELASSEALLLQLGLIQATVSDEETQKAQAAALMERYQARSAARQAAAQPDERFLQYKKDEKRIVSEVMATDSIPDGLSRDQYLRQRLQEARERAYQ
ncbi:MAG: hypothetical protein ACN6O6_11675 [Pseudomonas sp.]|uniref:hypothetical protein n=1 Tax=Pseudomonas sp. TaxID=306 RepID=UPI003D0DE707